jgi:hypothetical protein
VADALNTSSFAAGLSPAEKKKIDDLRKVLNVHRELSNLPSDVAKQVVTNYTPEQQKSLVDFAGNEDPEVKPKKGWLGTAWHYTGGQVVNAGGQLLKGLNYVSDLSTQAARAGQIALEEGKSLGRAWDEAGISGEKKFNENRLESARRKFGADAVDVAVRISSGEAPDQIAKDATPAQLKYLSLADKTQGSQEERDLFQDTLDSVSAAKYSPGRFVANLVDSLTPGDMVKNGFLYKGISGFADAAYRIFADPLLVAGKAKRLYDVQKYALDVVIGNKKVAEVFAEPKVADFWNRYGAELENFRKAKKAKDTNAAVAAEKQLQTLAPEFGPAVIKSFNDVEVPISNALTAKAFFENTKQVDEMMKGSIGRKRVLVPRMDLGRKTRVNFLTTANKVFNMDKVGPSLVSNTYFGGNATDDGIAQAFIDGKDEIITNVKARMKPDRTARLSTAQISYRIDRFKAKFAIAPLFKDDVFDVTAAGASTQIYRLARLVLPQKESKLIASAFDSIDDTARRKDVFYGLWSTIADARGLNATEPGQLIVRRLKGKGETKFAVTRAGENPAQVGQEQLGLIVSDLSSMVTAPNVVDIDRAATRSTLVQKMLGQANKDWVDKMTASWSFLTLAGPRYALRNATEDLMVNIAIGQSPWGIAKARLLSTRLNTARGLGKGLTKGEKRASNPLGSALRILNKKEADGFAKEIAGLDDRIKSTRKEIADLKKSAKAEVDPKKKKITEDKIKELSDTVKGGSVYQTRVVFARALNEGKLNRAFAKLGRGPLNKEESGLLAEQILHGDLDNALADVIEASTNFAVGNDYITSAREFTKKHGVRSVALKIEAPTNYRRAKGATGYKEIPVAAQDESSLISWLMRISYYSNDELGAIAVANLDNKEVAIAKIKQWFKDNPETAKQFRFQTATSQDQHAESIYNAARQIFEKQDPTQLNLDLLNKIRTIDEETGEWVISGKLSLDDLPNVEADLPRYVLGPQLVAVSDTDNYTTSLMEKGWTWLGMSNARMSREPIVLAEMIRMRQQMRKSGFEDAFIQAHLKDVDPTDLKKIESATLVAKKKIAEIAEERATLQTLAFVDNPLIRSQLAFSVRNFARFYRATEDFYRRIYRAVRYNPDSIVKAALTYEGITHSGWVQRDDQGEPYFIYPGIEPVYRAVQGALQGLGVPAEFKTPLPIQFGAQFKMITPSLNPESWVPTFAGPVSGVSVKVLSNIVDIWNPGAADTITRLTLGKYAEDQPMVSAFLPAHINRLYAAMDRDERDSQYASAWRKAVTYLEASGNGIPKKYEMVNGVETLIPPSDAELEEYRLKVKNTTIGILGTRFVLGFIVPASPQVQLKSDMTDWMRDSGRANFKQAWNKLLDQYPGDYDGAMAKWVELYPNQIPFTVTESERRTVAPFRYAEESGAFVDQNPDLFQKYRQGAAFLIPHKSGFSWDAYKTMTDIGLRQNKRVEEYLREVQTAADLQTYYARKEQYEKDLESAGIDYTRSKLRKEFTEWATLFKAGRPLVKEELAQGGQKAVERLSALDDLSNMLNDPTITARPETQRGLKAMLDLYNKYKDEQARYDRFSGSSFLSSLSKDRTIKEMRQLALFNENTQAAYDVLFGRLLGE